MCVCVCVCVFVFVYGDRGLNFKESVKIKTFVPCRLNFCLISNKVFSVANTQFMSLLLNFT